MTTNRQANYSAPVIALLLSIGGCIFGFLGYQSYQAEQRYTSFVPVNAVVTSSHTYSVRSGRSYSWHTRIEFEYAGNDGVTRSKTKELRESVFRPEWGAASGWDEGQWRVGHGFTAYINPNNSNDWNLEQGPSRDTYGCLTLGTLMALIGGLMFYPMLFRLFGSDPGPAYLPPDDPRALMRDNRDMNTYYRSRYY